MMKRHRWDRQVLGGLMSVLLWSGAAAAEDAAVVAPAPAESEPAAVPPPMTVQDNMTVRLTYTLTVDGSVIDSTEGHEPLTYIQGHGQLIPGLERQLAGLQAGQTRQVTVPPEEGYGPVDPAAIITIPKAQLPSDITPKAGLRLTGTKPDGETFRATVKEVAGDHVVLDLNHPLAGKTLQFAVTVVSVSSSL